MASNLQIKPLFIFGFGTSEDKVGTSECNQIQQVFKDRKMWDSFCHCQP